METLKSWYTLAHNLKNTSSHKPSPPFYLHNWGTILIDASRISKGHHRNLQAPHMKGPLWCTFLLILQLDMLSILILQSPCSSHPRRRHYGDYLTATEELKAAIWTVVILLKSEMIVQHIVSVRSNTSTVKYGLSHVI